MRRMRFQILQYTSRCTIFFNSIKFQSTLAEDTVKNNNNIPQPRGLPIVGTTLSLILAGSSPYLHWYIDKRHRKLGPIFKEKIGPVPCIFVSDPDAIRTIFAHEGKYPVHILPEAWTTYNTLHNISRGIFFMNGEEWLHFRRILNPLLLKGDKNWLEENCQSAIGNLIEKLDAFALKCENCFPNLEELLYRWSLEVILATLIGKDEFSKDQHYLNHEINTLASVVQNIFETSSKMALISSNFASKHQLKRWKDFEASVTMALKATSDLVEVLLQRHGKQQKGLLGKFSEQMTTSEVVRIVTDLILAAGDTTAYSMEWLLYLVGKNSSVQKKLREEIAATLEKGESAISNTYLKNVVKESLRLYPVAPFLTRILPEAVNIKGYDISKGTILILSIFSTGRDARYFQNPSQFDPDRWARKEIKSNIVQSANLPFAIGARSCIGKKLAETQLQSTLSSMVQHFEFEVVNKNDVEVILKMVAVPGEKIQLKLNPIK